MSYHAAAVGELAPVFLNSYDNVYGGGRNIINAGAPSSSTWSAINRIIYVPFTMPSGGNVYRYFWANGATVGTNNFQVGVYTTAFAAVNRGTSTLSAGANICQFDNVTDYFLPGGRYYMALWGSGTTATVMRATNTAGQGQGVYYETNASGLPTTGTPVDPAGTVAAYLPLFGLALRATDP